ncbi:uncharacterized protein LOC144432088 isoform X2 [Styela clava]
MNVDNFNNFQACSQQSRVLKKRRSGSVCTRYGVTAPPAQTVIVTTETQKTKDQPAKMWREYSSQHKIPTNSKMKGYKGTG